MELRLVHLSDIHFQGYGAGWDEDKDQRAELIRDLTALDLTGKVGGVIVGGDIAFSAEEDQYATARTWLDDVCTTLGITAGRVWVVPGNHDVHRATIGHSAFAKDFRHAIRQCEARSIDGELRARLSRDPAAEGLFLPLRTYNDFASTYGCGVTANQPHWYDDTTLVLNDYQIRLTGLNSALISDQHDADDDDVAKLVLGSYQCTLPRGDKLIHVAVAHHPPSWIRDWAHVEPYLRRAHVLLFGHEHKFSAQQPAPGGTAYVYAGAVGPERMGGDPSDEYLPSWALLTLSVDGEELDVKVEPRVWDRRDTRFVLHPDGVQEFKVALEPTGVDVGAEPAAEERPPVEAMSASPLAEETDSSTGPATSPSRRLIGLRFMRATQTRRLEIARSLGVLDEPEDLTLPPPKLAEIVLTRIRDRGKIEALVAELERG